MMNTTTSKSKRKCVFSGDLQRKYPCFRLKPNGKSDAQCTICDVSVSLANKGKYDLEQHIASKKHSTMLRAGETSKVLTNFFAPTNLKLDERVAAVEGTLAFHTLKHHFSFRSTDCTTKLLSQLFSDSETAKRISSAQTKTRAIAKHVIAPYCIQNVVDSVRQIPFLSVSTDGSNHGAIKLFPLVIQYFSSKDGRLTKLLYLDNLPNETAETISDYIMKLLNKYHFVDKCVAFSGDNCNTNFGGVQRKGINYIFI